MFSSARPEAQETGVELLAKRSPLALSEFFQFKFRRLHHLRSQPCFFRRCLRR